MCPSFSKRFSAFALIFLSIFCAPDLCLAAAIQSNATGGGNWSLAATWSPAQVPTAADSITIRAGDVVTVDITTTTVSAATISSGTLRFSRVSNSSFTLVGGNMIVTAGGTLDMGTEASPIPAGVKAHLILALGSSAGQYSLNVNNGGNFTVRGATKTPMTTAVGNLLTSQNTVTLADDPALMGWSIGDTVTIGPGNAGQTGPASTEERFITAVAGNTLTLNSNFSSVHYGTWTVQVADLTRNVLVRSSGTIVDGAGGNSAYLKSLTANATSFSLAYGEFAYLGANASYIYGVVLDGSGGPKPEALISSCTFRQNYVGVYAYLSNNVRIGRSLMYKNVLYGAAYDAVTKSSFDSSQVYGNGYHGFVISDGASFIRLARNQVYGNIGIGIVAGVGSDYVLVSNTVYGSANTASGIEIDDSGNHLLVSNNAYSNSTSGIAIDLDTVVNSNSVLIGNASFQNGTLGLSIGTALGNVVVDGSLGYDLSGNPARNLGAEFAFNAADTQKTAVFKNVRINPASGIDTSGFNRAGASLLSYGQDYSTGSLRLWGDYALSGSTWTFDQAAQLYASTATAPKLMLGTGHTASVLTPSDANAVSQLITIQRAGNNWRVIGSSAGLLGTFAGPIVNQPFPAGAAQFNLTFTDGASPQDGDIVDFALIAASRDAGRQKRLLFGPSDSSLNKGRSKLAVASSGGIVLKGIAGSHALMDMIAGGTYYTFVDSGAFTAQFSSMTNMDPLGLQLSGAAGVSLANAVFDFMGIADATNTYITARALTSLATYAGVAFGVSRATQSYSYNVRVTGADAGLNWTFSNPPSGNLWGETYNADPNGRVSWGSGNTAPTSPSVAAINLSSFTIAFTAVAADAYIAETSTMSNYSGTIFRSSTTAQASSLVIGSLAQNTTYYARIGALWGNTTFYADLGTVATLAASPGPISFSGITGTGFTVNWQANSNAAGTLYQAAVSTDINFGIFTSSLTTAAFSLALGGLPTNATFYARVRAVNWSGTLSGDALGVVLTAGGVITISANRLPSVWYNTPSAVFNAQGAVSYHYLITSNPADLPGAGDPVFNGSALSTAVLQGNSYFHIWGRDGIGASLGFAHFGPMNTDTVSPTVASLSAQVTATDPTPVADGGVTIVGTPRLTWPAAVSLSPIVGYAFTLSADPAVVPSAVTTTLLFTDQSLAGAGLYYAKIRALNLAGSLGPVAGMSFTYNTVPGSSAITIKRSYFNPLRGECLQLSIAASGAGRQKAIVYTLLGEKVSTLIDQDMPAGTFGYSWCGKNGADRTVATGVYLLHVESPQQKRDVHIAVAK